MTILVLAILLAPWPTTPAEWQYERTVLNAQFYDCMTGPVSSLPAYDLGCDFFDREPDGHIDMRDYACVQRCIGHLMRCRVETK